MANEKTNQFATFHAGQNFTERSGVDQLRRLLGGCRSAAATSCSSPLSRLTRRGGADARWFCLNSLMPSFNPVTSLELQRFTQ